MRVFVTGATGLDRVRRRAGNCSAPGTRSLGLARSDKAAAAVTAAGAEVFRGSLEDTDGLRDAAAERRRRDPHRLHPRLLPHRRPGRRRRARRAGHRRLRRGPGRDGQAAGRRLRAAGAPAGGRSRPRRSGSENPAHPRESSRPRWPSPSRRARLGGPAAPVGARRGRLLRSSPSSSASPGRPGCPPTSATAPTCGRPCTGWTPPGCSGSPWSRRRPGRC